MAVAGIGGLSEVAVSDEGAAVATGAGGGSEPQPTNPSRTVAATRAAPIDFIFVMFALLRRQRRRRSSSSTGQLQILLPLVFLSLDLHPFRHRVGIARERREVRLPGGGAPHNLPVVDHAVPIEGHHRHLAGDLKVSQHGAHRGRRNQVGVTAILNVLGDCLDGLVVRNNVKIYVRVF